MYQLWINNHISFGDLEPNFRSKLLNKATKLRDMHVSAIFQMIVFIATMAVSIGVGYLVNGLIAAAAVRHFGNVSSMAHDFENNKDKNKYVGLLAGYSQVSTRDGLLSVAAKLSKNMATSWSIQDALKDLFEKFEDAEKGIGEGATILPEEFDIEISENSNIRGMLRNCVGVDSDEALSSRFQNMNELIEKYYLLVEKHYNKYNYMFDELMKLAPSIINDKQFEELLKSIDDVAIQKDVQEAFYNNVDINDKKSLNDQLDEMIKNKYTFINYNGLRRDRLKQLTHNFEDNIFDASLCVAAYHHLDNEIDRKKALDEMYRVLKIGGKCFIEVWAIEQAEKLNKNTLEFKNKNNLVKWTSVKTNQIYYRYYNIYSKNELMEEIIRLKPEFKINKYGYEKGNYYIILEK
jgi:SAM-dependent methyltransferase